MEKDKKYKGKGPYTVSDDGIVSDREVWSGSMDTKTEKTFDNYM